MQIDIDATPFSLLLSMVAPFMANPTLLLLTQGHNLQSLHNESLLKSNQTLNICVSLGFALLHTHSCVYVW
jgi:hypothetical protein